MSKKILSLEANYANDVHLIDIFLTIHSVSKGINLRGFSRRVLKYYIKYGYTDEAERYIIEDYMEESKITTPTDNDLKKIDQRIRTANVDLRDLGYLEHGTKNLRKSRLSDEMELLRDKLINDRNSLLLITFKNV